MARTVLADTGFLVARFAVEPSRCGIRFNQIVRNDRHIARLVPEAPRQDALSVFGDLYRTLDDETADALSAAIASHRQRRRGRVSELNNPWAG